MKNIIIVIFLAVTIAISLVGTAAISFASDDTSLPYIADSYPQCEYVVIDTVNVKGIIKGDKVTNSNIYYDKAFSKVVSKLVEKAVKVNADLIALTGKSFTNSRNRRYLNFRAELIKNCNPDIAIPVVLTKFNSKGLLQFAIASSKIPLNKAYEINLPSPNKRQKPPLTTNNVSLKEGAYGVKLNENIDHVIEKLGTPSIEIDAGNNTEIIAYGRQHYFTFMDKKLKAITSFNKHLSADVNNLLAFDNRLDDLTWVVEGVFVKQEDMPNNFVDKITGNEILLYSDSSVLKVNVENYLTIQELSQKRVVTGYSLETKNHRLPSNSKTKNAEAILPFIYSYLKKDAPTFLVTDIPYKPTLSAWLGRGKYLYTYGQHVAIESNGERVTKVHVFESLFAKDSIFYHASKWKLGRFKQDMSEALALKTAGSGGTYFNQELEITKDTTSQKYYFYSHKGEVKLYAGELLFH